MHLSQHFTLEEFIRSDMAKAKGIQNIPGEPEIQNAEALCEFILDPVRKYFGKPVRILSGYRSPKLNAAVNGAPASQHVSGQAADISILGIKNVDLWNYIFTALPFDQLIAEKLSRSNGAAGWVHVSYDAKRARKDALSYNGRSYLKGLHYVD